MAQKGTFLGPAGQRKKPTSARIMETIRNLESGGDYNAKGKSGEFGAYQFMPDTWANWSKEVFGEPAQPTPENQDRVARAKIQEWVKQGYEPRQVASLWNSGEPNWTGKKGVNDQGVEYDTPAYVEKFQQEFQKTEPGQGQKGRLIRPLKQPFTEEMSRARVKSGVDEIAQRIQEKNEQGIFDFLAGKAKDLGDAVKEVGRTGPPLSREERLQDLEEVVQMQRTIGDLRGDNEALARADRLGEKVVQERSDLERRRAELREKGQRSILGSAQGPAQAGVITRDTDSFGDFLKQGTKKVAKDTLHFWEMMSEQFGQLQQEAWDKLPKETQKKFLRGRDEPAGSQFITQEDTQKFADAIRGVAEDKFKTEDLDPGTGAEKYLKQVTQIAPQVGTQILATVLGGPAAGLSTIGAQIGGATYDELKEQGVDPERAFKASMANAAAQGALEQVGIGRALRGWSPGQGAKKALADLTGRFGTEWFTEFSQAFPDTMSKLWAKSEDMDDFVQKVKETDWGDVAQQGAYEGTLTMPFAGLGMALSAKADKRGRIPALDPDEVLGPEQSRDLPPSREGMEGPIIDVEGREVTDQQQRSPAGRPIEGRVLDLRGRPVGGTGQTPARLTAGAQRAVKGRFLSPLESGGTRRLPAARRSEPSGRAMPVGPEQQPPGTTPIEMEGPTRQAEGRQRVIDQARQRIQDGTLDRSAVIGRKGDEFIAQITQQGRDQQVTIQPDGAARKRQGKVPEEDWDEIILDNRPQVEPQPKQAPESPEGLAGEPQISPQDLPYEVARRAHMGTSHTPEDRGKGEQEDYARKMRNTYQELSKLAQTPEQKGVLNQEFKRYQGNYLNKLKSQLEAKSRIVSPLVAGPSNFPTRKMERANKTADKRLQELISFDKKARQAIRRKIQQAAPGEERAQKARKTIDSDLATIKSIESGEAKGYDKALFKNGIVQKLETLAKHEDAQTVRDTLDYLRKKQDEIGVKAFTDRHSIWKMDQKAQEARDQEEAAESGTVASFEGATIEQDPADERVRIYFDEKPSEEIRSELKQSAWKWSRTNKAWQRKNTPRAQANATRILGRHFNRIEQETDGQGQTDQKQPWQMTRQEWFELQRQKYADTLDSQGKHKIAKRVRDMPLENLPREGEFRKMVDGHRMDIEQALSQGENVPDQVLQDYPDIARDADIKPSLDKLPASLERAESDLMSKLEQGEEVPTTRLSEKEARSLKRELSREQKAQRGDYEQKARRGGYKPARKFKLTRPVFEVDAGRNKKDFIVKRGEGREGWSLRFNPRSGEVHLLPEDEPSMAIDRYKQPASGESADKPQLDTPQKWLQQAFQSGQEYGDIMWALDRAVQDGELTQDQAGAVANALMDFDESTGRDPTAQDLDEILARMETGDYSRKEAQGNAELSAESIDQINTIRDMELDLYQKGVKRIKDMGGLNSAHARYEFGHKEMMDLAAKFGQGLIKRDGLSLDVVAQALAQESPELGIEPGGDIASLYDFLTDRAKSKRQIEQDYKQALSSLQESDRFSVGESDARYKISSTRRSDGTQPGAAAPRKGYLHSAQRIPGQKSLFDLDFYQPEKKPQGQKGLEGLKDPGAIVDDVTQFYGPQVGQVQVGTFSHQGGPIRSGQDVARLVRPLAKKAQENLCLVCLDQNKNPIAVLRHTVGSESASQAFAHLMLGSVYEVPGTSSFWMVHNHPSASPDQSNPDIHMTRLIADMVNITNAPAFEGSVVVTNEGTGSTITMKKGAQQEKFTIAPNLESPTQTVPFLEREYMEFEGRTPDAISTPDDVINFMQDHGLDRDDGILLLNSQNKPVANIKLSKGEMNKLRIGKSVKKVGAAAKLYRALARSNANAMIPHTSSGDEAGINMIMDNLKGFAKVNNLRVVDMMADGQSFLSMGKYYGHLHNVNSQFEEPKGVYGKDQGGPPRIPGNPDKLLGQFNNLPIKKFMGGGNADENVNDLLRNMQAQAKKKGGKLDLSDDDIGFIRAHTSLPYWLAKDDTDFARVYQVQQERVQSRNVTREALLEEARPFLDARTKLGRRQKRKLNQLIRKLDRDRIKPMTVEFDRVVQELGVDNQVAEAYMSARRVLDFIWHEHLPSILKNLGHTDNEIEQYRREAGNVDGYWPRRRRGRYYIKASKGDQALYREHFDDIIATLTKGKVSPKLKAKQKRLKKDYPGTRLSAGKVRKLTDEIYFQVSPEAMDQVIDAALKSKQAREAGADTDEMRQAIKSAVADVFKQRGFMAHGIQRQDVEGYDTSDPWQDLVEYISGYSGFITKLRAAPEFTAALRQIPAQDKENLYQYATKYVRDVMQVADAFDQAVDKARGVMFHWYLGGSLKSAVLNLTQNWIAGVPVLRQYTGFPEKDIAREMSKAMSRVVRDIGNTVIRSDKEPAWKRTLPQDVVAGLNRARKKGVIDDQYTQELLGTTLSSFGSKLRRVENASRFFFGNAEILNRESMWTAAYNLAKKKGLNTEAAYEFAEKVTLDTHYAYGQGSLPPFARGGKPAKAARSMYTFRSYTHNLLSLYRHLAKNHQGMSLGRSFLYLLAFGGLGGIPLYDNLERWWQKMTGENVRSEVTKQVDGWKEDLVKYGLPGLADIDLSGSISIEVPTSIKDIPGVPVDMFWTRMGQVAGDIARDDYWRAMEDFAPTAIANPMKAYRLHEHGQTTRGGAPVRNDQGEQIKLTPMEAVRKGLGFQPVKNSEGFRRWQARTEAMQDWQDKKFRLLDAFHRAGQRHGYQSKQAQKVIKDIEQFNKEVPPYVAPVTRQTLRSRLRGPSRREEAAMQEFQ